MNYGSNNVGAEANAPCAIKQVLPKHEQILERVPRMHLVERRLSDLVDKITGDDRHPTDANETEKDRCAALAHPLSVFLEEAGGILDEHISKIESITIRLESLLF